MPPFNIIKPLVPTTVDAVRMYEALNGRLSRDSHFGLDPLIENERRYNLRRTLFLANQPSAETIFSDVVHGETYLIKTAIEYFYDVTCRLA